MRIPRWTFVLLWAAQRPRDERRPSGLQIAWRLISPPFFSLRLSDALSGSPTGLAFLSSPVGLSGTSPVWSYELRQPPSSLPRWGGGCISADSAITVFCTHSFLASCILRLFPLRCSPQHASSLRSRFALSLRSAPGWIRGGGYSSKDLGALHYEDKRHLGEMVQQASVLKLVEEG